jgi:hypothetical protein
MSVTTLATYNAVRVRRENICLRPRGGVGGPVAGGAPSSRSVVVRAGVGDDTRDDGVVLMVTGVAAGDGGANGGSSAGEGGANGESFTGDK